MQMSCASATACCISRETPWVHTTCVCVRACVCVHSKTLMEECRDHACKRPCVGVGGGGGGGVYMCSHMCIFPVMYLLEFAV